MAAVAVAVPSQAPPYPEHVQGVNATPAKDAKYTDPRTAPKTKSSPFAEKLAPKPAGPNQLYKQKDAAYDDWRDNLVRDGFAVVKGVVPKERALAYGDEVFNYLETL